MADLLVRPVADIEGAVRTDALRHRDEMGIVAAQEIIAVMTDVAAARGHDLIGDEAMTVQVAEDEHTLIGGREIIAVVDR